MNGEPRFAQLPLGPTPTLRKLADTALRVFLAAWLVLPVLFEPPTQPIHIRPLALSYQSCKDWEPIINGMARLPKFGRFMFKDVPAAITEECRQLAVSDVDPSKSPGTYIRPGEVVAIFDPSRSECGTGEARSRVERYYQILCSPNPDTFNALSWPHELFHLAHGHTALWHSPIRLMLKLPAPVDSYAKAALNAFLDVAYVWPALAFGIQGSAWFRMAVVLGSLLIRYWPPSRRMTRSALMHRRYIRKPPAD